MQLLGLFSVMHSDCRQASYQLVVSIFFLVHEIFPFSPRKIGNWVRVDHGLQF